MRNRSSSPVWAGLAAIMFLVVLLGVPILLLVFGAWRVFFTATSLWLGYAAAGIGSAVIGSWTTRKTQRSIDMGKHESLARGARLPWRQHLLAYSSAGVMSFALSTSVLWIVAMLSLPPLAERELSVAQVQACTGKQCFACAYKAQTLLRFEVTDTAICADEVQPALRAGERIIVRGYFHPLLIHIDAVRRAPGAAALPP